MSKKVAKSTNMNITQRRDPKINVFLLTKNVLNQVGKIKDASKFFFWFIYKKDVKSTMVPPIPKFAVRMHQNAIFRFMCQKLKKFLLYHMLWKFHNGCTKIPFLSLFTKNIVKGGPVSPIMKIALRLHQNFIFAYMAKKVSKSALVPPISKILFQMQQNSIF